MPAILEGKVALVTGVSQDGQVGQAVARKLAENGCPFSKPRPTTSDVEMLADCAGWA